MLASITPLGERSRGNSHSVTITAFVIGCVAGATFLGSVLGELGSFLALDPGAAVVVVAMLCVAGFLIDLNLFSVSLPTPRRQVDAAWLETYRGSVYGCGFGAQLGFAVVTVVPSFLTYIWISTAVLAGSAWGGAVLGITFGLLRGLGALPSVRVTSPARLGSLSVGLNRWEPRVHLASLAMEGTLGVLLVLTMLV